MPLPLTQNRLHSTHANVLLKRRQKLLAAGELPLERRKAFTLAELLIALAILGVIATFTIPKILHSGAQQEWVGETKETAQALSEAYLTVRQSPGLNNAAVWDIINKLNIAKTQAQMNGQQVDTGFTCNTGIDACVQLHNGGVLYGRFDWGWDIPGNPTDGPVIYYDPDGKVSDSGYIAFVFLNNGRVVDGANDPGGWRIGGSWSEAGPDNPAWFKWN